ncbi:MAG: phosphonate ABC transporter substrate-binding protein [Cyanobacteria bacterium J06642_2]
MSRYVGMAASLTLALASVGVVSLPVNAQEDITELSFGIISTESQANQIPLWEPFVEELSTCIALPVKAFYSTQYAGIIEAMRFDQVDIAWYGGKSYIEAAKIAEAEAFAQTVATDGSTGYYSYLITNADNPILDDIDLEAQDGDEYVIANADELTFAFNDPNSTSGFLVPSFYVFAQNGVNPNEAFERLIFAGSHEATALAVANNQVDVATNNNESLARLEETDPEALENIEVIWTSPIIPSDPIAYRSDLPEALKATIRDCFYNFDNEAILTPLQWSELVPADDSGWDTIRELDIAKRMAELENSDLSDADKKAGMAELQDELAALGN